MIRRAMVWCVVVLAALSWARRGMADETCVLCHAGRQEEALRNPVLIVGNSAHGRVAEMSCANCHGGDREDPTARAHDPEAGFVARFGPEEVPGRCGGCHADRRRLGTAADSLPTDQRHLYERSGHGRALARGNGAAATCISCHGTHDARSPTDPESLVHPDNIATTCGACHSDPQAMTGSGALLTQVSQWRRSVHGRAFVERENPEAPTCNGCHDAHGGITGLDDVAACARCHPAQELSFSRSRHATEFRRLGFAGCVECHGSHEIRPAHASLVGVMRESACLRCHRDGQVEVYETIVRMGERRIAAEDAYRRGVEALAWLGAEAPSEPELQSISESLEDAMQALSLSVHAFDEEGVEQAVRATTEAAARAVALRRSAESRPDHIGVSLWVVAAMAIIAIITLSLGRLVRRRQ